MSDKPVGTMSSTANPSAMDSSIANISEGAKNSDIAVELPQACQRRKRPRPRRKRKLGKATYLGARKLSASDRAQQVRTAMFSHGQPVAPYNTTQFLIEDHGDVQNIDAQLRKPSGSHRPSRTRDSSFSIDSDDDYFYSSPEDEEEFLTKEFSLEYQDRYVEHLNSLPKAEIIHDYLLLEGKYEKSMGELRKLKGGEQSKVSKDSGRDTDASSRSDADIGEQLRLAHLENRRLKAELEKLKRENSQMHGMKRHEVRRGSASSVDTESDSSSSSSVSSSSSDSSFSGRSRSSINISHQIQKSITTPVDTDTCMEMKVVKEVEDEITTGLPIKQPLRDAVPLLESHTESADTGQWSASQELK